MMTARTSTPYRAARIATACALISACMGCYDGQVLVERARHDALKTRIETVDLGRLAITMPGPIGNLGMTEVQVDPFGRTVRYKVADLQQQIEENEYRLRHAMLLTIRSSAPEDFADPDLTRLRERLLVAVNEAMGGRDIDSIGFHNVRFVRH